MERLVIQNIEPKLQELAEKKRQTELALRNLRIVAETASENERLQNIIAINNN